VRVISGIDEGGGGQLKIKHQRWVSLSFVFWSTVAFAAPGEHSKGELLSDSPAPDVSVETENVQGAKVVIEAVEKKPLFPTVQEEEFAVIARPRRSAVTEAQAVTFAQIEVLESARRMERSVWRGLLASQDPAVVVETLRSLGRVQAMELLGLIESRLADSVIDIRLEAAFAYGQTPGAGTGPLTVRLGLEKDPRVRKRLVEAIAKRGGVGDVSTLTSLNREADIGVRAASLVALAVIAHRVKVEILGLDGLWLAPPTPGQALSLRYSWAYLALRARKNTSPLLLASLSRCIKDPAPAVRALCARALGRFADAGHVQRKSLINDRNWRVQVASARADLEAKDTVLLANRFVRLTQGVSDGTLGVDGVGLHVILTVIDALHSMPAIPDMRSVEKSLFEATSADTSETPSTGRAHLNCAAAALVDRRRGKPRLTQKCGGTQYSEEGRQKWMVLVTSGLKKAARLKVLSRMYRGLGTAGKLAVIESLATLPKSAKSTGLIVQALDGDEPALAGTAAQVAAGLKLGGVTVTLTDAYKRFYARREFETVQAIFGAFGTLAAEESHEILNRHSTDSHPGVRYAAKQALNKVDAAIRLKMTQSGTSGTFLPERRSFLPPPAESFGGEKPDTQIVKRSRFDQAILKTSKGEIRIQLYRDDARETVKNFTNLVQRKYYDGLIFHRVVPAFIIQTGDPQKTGWGGPGYTIPCEVNPRGFERGTVGMALSGKDTGGGQFFITQDRAPHLDGQYTVFGQVVEGLNVVESISEGDRISSVELRSFK
jgi:cyclophilin family peptidyl-prolyl cis-trans isomerase/HEAT repeat protein